MIHICPLARVEKSNCEHLWCDHGSLWKKVSLLPAVKGELTSGWKEPPAEHCGWHCLHKYEKYWTSNTELGGDQGGWVKVEAWQRRQPQLKSFGGLLNTPEDIKGNVRKFEKIKNLKLNSQTTKKGETREEATSANEERSKPSFERKEKNWACFLFHWWAVRT